MATSPSAIVTNRTRDERDCGKNTALNIEDAKDVNAPVTINVANRTQDEHYGSGNVALTIQSARQVTAPITITLTRNDPTPDAKTAADKPTREIRSCCQIIDGDGKKLCDLFETKLRRFNGNLALPKVAWMKEGELSVDEHFIQLELNESKKPLEIEEVFSWVKNKPPLRILIEGQPGFGKTTLAIKFAHDWAMSEKYINFKFALLVHLRDLRQGTFESVIEAIGNRFDSPNILPIINNHRSKTLFLLDGLDELTPEERRQILKILVGSEYGDVTVVVFCRTGLFRLSSGDRSELFGSFQMVDKFSDKRIYSLGITSPEKKRQFLEKLLVPKDIIENIVATLSSQWALFDSPLLLMLLAIIIEEGETIHDFTTKTDLFKQLFNLILKQSFTKRGQKIENGFDLFRLNSSLNSIQQLMKQFGMLAAKKIIANNLTFETSELTAKVYELGFLTHHEEVARRDAKSHYEAFHLSILEFTAAFAIWTDLKLKNFASVKSDLILVIRHFLTSGGTSLIMPFIASLLEGQLDLSLSLMESHRAWLIIFDDLLVKLISECSPNNIHQSYCLKNVIAHYIQSINSDHRNEKIYAEMLKYGITRGIIKVIEINSQTKLEMFTNEIRTCLQINFDLNSDTEFTAWSPVACNPTQVLSHPIPFQGPLNQCLHFAASPRCESCDLHLTTSETSSQFLKLVNEHKVFDRIKFRDLKIGITTECEKQIVIKLVENDQVECLHLTRGVRKQSFFLSIFRSKKFDMKEFSIAAAKSQYLAYLTLVGFTIDLYDLTNGGTKKYLQMSLFDCTLTCREALAFRDCVHHSNLYDEQPVGAIVETEPSVVDSICLAGIYFVMEKYPSWRGFETVKTLRVKYPEPNFVFVNPFTNLRTLELSFSEEIDAALVAVGIHELPIINLIINNDISSVIEKLFKCMNILWANEKTQLKTITLFKTTDVSRNNYLAAAELFAGLIHSHWENVNYMGGVRTNIDRFMNLVYSFNLFVKSLPCKSMHFDPVPYYERVPIFDNSFMICVTRKSDDE